jgi:molecular chaperone DnaJ
MKKSYYDVLGIEKTATADDIKKAYRKLAVKLHPDTNKNKANAENDFKELNEAYSILSDVDKRSAYDRYGDAAFSTQRQQKNSNPHFNFHNVFNTDHFNDEMFNQFFGGTFGRQTTKQPSKSTNGSTIHLHLNITLLEAYNGCIKEVTYTHATKCTICKGTGSSRAEKATHCKTCNGVGVTSFIDNTNRVRSQTCKSCTGLGSVVEYPCRACHGQGIANTNTKRELSIPRGIFDGTQIRIKSQGNAGPRNGTTGDLIVTVVASDLDSEKGVYREDEHLYKDIEIDYPSAVLGDVYTFTHIDNNTISVTLPKGIKEGQMLRIRYKGMPLINTENYGDLILKAHIIIPTNLDAETINILKQYQQQLNKNKTT